MPNAPRITIVTPTLDAGRYLRPLLESLWSQPESPLALEHIIVDGGSRDDTLAIATSYPSQVIAETAGNMYDAINDGLARARGDLFGYVNADDELLPTTLRDVTRAFARHPTAQWLVAPMVHIDDHGRTLATLRPPRWLSADRYRALGWNCFPQPSCFFRTALVRRLDGFRTEYGLAADYDLCARALARAQPLYLHAPLSRFRLHHANLSKRSRPRMLSEARTVAHDSDMSHWRRRALRLVTKLQINITNPQWALGKLTGRIHY